MTELAGQVVTIVGASSGIGLATAQILANAEGDIIMMSRSLEKLAAAADSISPRPRTIALDMLVQSDVERAFGDIDQLDHLVLTAVADELSRRAPIAQITNEQVERSFDKMRGFVNVVRAAAPRLSPRGSLTLMAGASALKPGKDRFSVLAAESASAIAFGKALALELAPLRVNVLVAGIVDTPIHVSHREDLRVWAEATLPARRFGAPDDIADAIRFLISNPYMTGHALIVDGGLTAL